MNNKRPYTRRFFEPDGSIPVCYKCKCCPARLDEHRNGKLYIRECSSCHHAICNHGFLSHNEYNEYLNQGCWVCGGTAIGIDHKHKNGCKSVNHSCDECRRGPICNRCNSILRAGRTIDQLEATATEFRIKAERTELVVKAMRDRMIEVA